jgi:hypothetical protein
MFIQTREIASILGGNTDVLAGLTTQAPTATQEQIDAGTAQVIGYVEAGGMPQWLADGFAQLVYEPEAP